MPAQVSQAPRCLQPLLFSTRGSPEGEVTPVQWTGGDATFTSSAKGQEERARTALRGGI